MPEAVLQQARTQAKQALSQLDSRYESDKAKLRAEFNLAETEAEKSSLARALGELNTQRDEGVKAISDGFAQARASVTGRRDEVAGRVETDAQAVGDLYRDASLRIGEGGERAADLAGGLNVGANAGGRRAAGVADLEGAAELAAAREQTLQERLGNLTVEDLSWLADNIGARSEAAQGSLRGDAMGLSAGLMGAHADRVGGRIQQERGLYQQGLTSMMDSFRNRGFQLEDTDIQLLQQIGQQRHTAQMQREQLAAQAAIAAANRAAAGRRGGGGGGGSRGMTNEEMARMKRKWDLEDRAYGDQPPEPGTFAGDLLKFNMQEKHGMRSNQFLRDQGYMEQPPPGRAHPGHPGGSSPTTGGGGGGFWSDIANRPRTTRLNSMGF